MKLTLKNITLKIVSQHLRKIQGNKMTEESVTNATKFNEKLIGLKEEFESKIEESNVSDSSEKLKEYKFMAILGQGAFGLVVICHAYDLSFPFR